MYRGGAVFLTGTEGCLVADGVFDQAVGTALANGGVMVLEVPATSAAARAGLRQGDLGIGAQGQPVKTADDLQRLAPAAGPVSLRIIRDQAERTFEGSPAR
jgi:S1-C subfamily serine protease